MATLKELYPVNPDICANCLYCHKDTARGLCEYKCDYITLKGHSKPNKANHDYCGCYEEYDPTKRKELERAMFSLSFNNKEPMFIGEEYGTY